ncbi:MAG: hypothetical protein BGP24_17245 [Lysobacterales bacterium 69-70]|nr:MAG: hypothetical protein ABT27_16425 [Xanthomonadaceae bacterium SCN 69-25]OJZ00260.1 MAG: hypothetical protein BGP24_17245 [Xanthomonadales bacterium 69-70]
MSMMSKSLSGAAFTPAHAASRRRLLAAALLFLPLAAAAAADWRYVETPQTSIVQPQFYRVGPDQALWNVSTDGVRRSAAGTTRLVHRTAYGSQLPAGSVRDLLPLADGGAVLDFSAIRGGIAYCNAARVTADGRQLWRIDLALSDELCNSYVANAAGQGWLATTSNLRPVDAAGRVGAIAMPTVLDQFGTTDRPLAALADGGVIAASRLRNSGISRLTRLDAAGRERWVWNRSDNYRLDRVTPVGDGVAAMAPSSGRDPAEVLRWNAGGQLLWTYRLPIDISNWPVVIASGVAELIAAGDGDVYVVVSAGPFRADSVVRLSPDGRARWQTRTECSAAAEPVFVRMADDGMALLCEDGPQSSRLLRLTRDGALSSLSLPLSRPRQLLLQGDGRLLALGDEPIYLDPVRRRSLLVDGTRVATAMWDDYRDAAPSRLIGKTVLAGGSAFVATAPETVSSSGRGFSLSRIGPDGRLLWQQQLDYPAARGNNGLAAGGGLVCVALSSTASEAGYVDGLVCLDAADGRKRWEGIYSSDQYGLAAIAIGEDGSVRTVRSRYNKYELQRFDRNGALQSIVNAPGQATSATFDARGAATVTTSLGLTQYAPDGSLRMQVPSAATPVNLGPLFAPIGPVVASDDGSVWLIAPPSPGSSSARRLWAVAPDGSTRWTRDLDGNGNGIGHLQLHGTTLLALGTAPGAASGLGQPVELRVERIEGIDGRTLSTDLARKKPLTTNGIAFAAASNGDALIAISEIDRLHLERIGAGGRPGHETTVACSDLCGAPAALRLDADGTARAIFGVLDRRQGQSAAVIAADLAPPTTRAGQPGIAGAWWSPYANGEGITFDWLPASRTLFGAWFTYSTGGGNAASELRWYTVQANGVADGARSVELPILQTGGGVFDAGPTVSPQRVGTAQLEFHDCDKATLRYAFDAPVNDGRRGTITLSRLSPATQSCVLADGSSLSGAGARPPQNGFDARLSGSWFDEATAGQGLEFTVQPGGVFFAPWFTFDPAGAADDPGRQHWFTLQGDLAQARDGKAELVLVQTLGGTFDRQPTYNANAIGSASLRVLGCDRAELDYRVDDTANAGAFRGRSGTLRLTRAGGCAP